jgi:hypothetical protein
MVAENRGVALILALLVLSFLTVLGGALLTAATVDVRIGDNFRTATQALYAADAGIEDARELLRSSSRTVSEWLAMLDDDPLIAPRMLTDTSGRSGGSYEVWAVGAGFGDVMRLVSVGRAGSSRKTIEAIVQKTTFPLDLTDTRLSSIAGLESLVAGITRNATDIYAAAAIGDLGSASDFRIAVANGDVALGPGAGYGLLVVRGNLTVVGDITWNGVIAAIGQGAVAQDPGVSMTVDGGILAARTRAGDGTLLSAPESVSYAVSDPGLIRSASTRLPYSVIAIRER